MKKPPMAVTSHDPKKSQRHCLFCGEVANSREHAITEWLSKRMAIRKLEFHPGHFSETEGLQLRPLVRCEHLKTKQVCKECNSGWMSDLEGWALDRFGPCVEPDWRPEQFAQIEKIQAESNQIIRWLLKTAIILERALPRGTMTKVVPSLYPVAKGSDEPKDFHVWASYIYERGFDLHVLRGFPVWNGGVLQPFQVHKESMNFGIQLNHLALRLFRCPSARPYIKGHILYSDGLHAMPLSLTEKANCPFPHVFAYPTFQYFMEALEVCANPPLAS